MRAWSEITRAVRERCAPAGIDLVQPLAVGWYNELVDIEHRLPDFDRPGALALCIANTSALWKPFIDHVAAVGIGAEPIDEYAELVIAAAIAPLEIRAEIRYAPDPPPRRVAMQKLALAAGLADLAPSYLSVHSTYGPWIGLRAAVVLDVDGPTERPPAPTRGCDCEGACLPALEKALATGLAVEERWRLWVGVRDACPIGREHRYEERQLRYHYTKDRNILIRAVKAR